jgi:hypothetical protein
LGQRYDHHSGPADFSKKFHSSVLWGANFGHGAGEGGKDYDQQSQRFNIGLATLRKDGFVYASSAEGRVTTKPIESKRGVIKVNADCTNGRTLIDVVRDSRKMKSFAIAGSDAVDRKLQTGVKGDIMLNITINDAKFYSIEVL